MLIILRFLEILDIENLNTFSRLLDLTVVIPQIRSQGVEEVQSLKSFLINTPNLTSLTMDMMGGYTMGGYRVRGYKRLKREPAKLLMDALSSHTALKHLKILCLPINKENPSKWASGLMKAIRQNPIESLALGNNWSAVKYTQDFFEILAATLIAKKDNLIRELPAFPSNMTGEIWKEIYQCLRELRERNRPIPR